MHAVLQAELRHIGHAALQLRQRRDAHSQAAGAQRHGQSAHDQTRVVIELAVEQKQAVQPQKQPHQQQLRVKGALDQTQAQNRYLAHDDRAGNRQQHAYQQLLGAQADKGIHHNERKL